jgi:hypothetical protein
LSTEVELVIAYDFPYPSSLLTVIALPLTADTVPVCVSSVL